jgi:hypothetical protein
MTRVFVLVWWLCCTQMVWADQPARFDLGFGRAGVAVVGTCTKLTPQVFGFSDNSFLVTNTQSGILALRRFDARGKQQTNFGRNGVLQIKWTHRNYSLREFRQEIMIWTPDQNPPKAFLLFDKTNGRLLESVAGLTYPKNQQLEAKEIGWINPKSLLIVYQDKQQFLVVKYLRQAAQLEPDPTFGTAGVVRLDASNPTLVKFVRLKQDEEDQFARDRLNKFDPIQAQREYDQMPKRTIAASFENTEVTLSVREDGYFLLSGRIFIVGYHGYVVRYLPNGKLKTDFADQGMWLSETPHDLGYYEATLLRDGHIRAFEGIDDSPQGDDMVLSTDFFSPLGKLIASNFRGTTAEDVGVFSVASGDLLLREAKKWYWLSGDKDKQRIKFPAGTTAFSEIGQRFVLVGSCRNKQWHLKRLVF